MGFGPEGLPLGNHRCPIVEGGKVFDVCGFVHDGFPVCDRVPTAGITGGQSRSDSAENKCRPPTYK